MIFSFLFFFSSMSVTVILMSASLFHYAVSYRKYSAEQTLRQYFFSWNILQNSCRSRIKNKELILGALSASINPVMTWCHAILIRKRQHPCWKTWKDFFLLFRILTGRSQKESAIRINCRNSSAYHASSMIKASSPLTWIWKITCRLASCVPASSIQPCWWISIFYGRKK